MSGPVGVALYAGSFDPPTYGHVDSVERASKLFPRVIVAIGVNPSRAPLFTVDERTTLLSSILAGHANVVVEKFEGLLVDYAKKLGARVIVRGLRVGGDFEYELQIAHANADLRPEIDTVFLPTRTNYGFIGVARARDRELWGDVSRYAPPEVCEALKKKFVKR